MLRNRPAFTATEMLVSLVLSAVVIAAVGALGFRQQRFHRDIVLAAERLEQLGQTTALIPVAVRGIAAGQGDIPAGSARDTSLEFRATIATAVACGVGNASVVLAPVQDADPQLASVLERPDAGDTLWSLALTDSTERWVGQSITAVVDSSVDCRIGGALPWGASASRSALAIRLATPPIAVNGLPMRITRRWRYSLYHASDGGWYLGAREWNAASLRFNTIQPVSGPFTSAATRGFRFRYFDSDGAEVASGSPAPTGIALVQIAVRVDSMLPGQYDHATSIRPTGMFSVALRNRP